MSAIRYLIIKILLFNCVFFSNSIASFELKKEQLEGSGIVSDLMPLNHDLNVNTNFESEMLKKLENAMDLLLTNRINSFEERIKSYLQTELSAIKSHKYHDKWFNNDKCSKNKFPESCFDIKECRNNVFSIMLRNISSKPFDVACDFETLNSGWTIIQRRQDGSENFFRNWDDYVKGFGDVHGEFFIGLEKLHALTSFGPEQELYIIMEDFEGTRKYARYTTFRIGPESTQFKLTVEGYSGDAGDSLTQHNQALFSTKDHDTTNNCANKYKGGWWYYSTVCHYSNLNGLYLFGKLSESKKDQGVVWYKFRGTLYSLKFVQMMVRPKQ